MSDETPEENEEESAEEKHPAVAAAKPVVEACLAGAATQVGPLIGVEPEQGEVDVDVEEGPPEGELAVLTLSIQRGEDPVGSIEVVSPLSDLVVLARRVNGESDGDDKEEISEADGDAIGEVLKLLGAAVEEAVQQVLDPGLEAECGDWWRSDEPGDQGFAAAECVLGAGSLDIPGGSSTPLFFRFATQLFELDEDGDPAAPRKLIVLIDLGEELQSAFTDALGSRAEFVSAEDDAFGERCVEASALVLDKEREDCLERCRQLRLDSPTWRKPIVICAAEPDREWVLQALDQGASHVLCTPAEASAIQRVLKEAEFPG